MKLPINGVEYRAEVRGTGSPLVLLHGFTGSTEIWQPHVEMFARNHQVITLDILGHGQSSKPLDPERYRMERVADDLRSILETLKIAPVHLLGYSMGGRLALYFAVHYPQMIQSLILESASPGLATESERAARLERDHVLADRIEREGIEAFVDFWEQLPLWESQQNLPTELREKLRHQRLKNDPPGLANSLRGMGTGEQPSLWNELETLQRSVLLMAGALDTKYVQIAEQMHDHFPNSQVAIIPHAGHTIHLEQPEAFQQEITSFL